MCDNLLYRMMIEKESFDCLDLQKIKKETDRAKLSREEKKAIEQTIANRL